MLVTTNEKLTETITNVNELIEWAEGDVDSSVENDARDQAKADRARVRDLKKAKALLQRCFR